MKSLMKTAGLLAIVLGLTTTLAVAAGNPNPRVIPINASAYGQAYGEWSGAWWLWAYSFPMDATPVGDATGELAWLGQSGPVFFLAGTYGTTAERSVTVPPGTPLFFPIINTMWINVPEFGDAEWSDEQREFAFDFLAPFIDQATVACQIDGAEVADLPSYRCKTPYGSEYMVTFTVENNAFGLPIGTYGPAVDDGIYLMLPPLPPGEHTIHFTAESTDFWGNPFSLEVTYHLTVATPKAKAAALLTKEAL